jgi:hypothetical protein
MKCGDTWVRSIRGHIIVGKYRWWGWWERRGSVRRMVYLDKKMLESR